MRIQHNIMAMSAYRNYTNNVSAMKKNLEKLSSGYKINRAGDDAAGLAISEKMRAQITGLETAQKNAKDGISLVQTAEGALTEVHDMLNRMVELATQSANGTYDNTTDRAQMEKELNQLRSEINRIADSSNFNGIKLLDGSMSEEVGKVSEVTLKAGTPETPTYATATGVVTWPADNKFVTNASKAPTATTAHLHAGGAQGALGEFTIDLGGLKLDADGAAKGKINITIGGATYAYEAANSNTAITASMVAADLRDNYVFTVSATGTEKLVKATAANGVATGALVYKAEGSGNTVTFKAYSVAKKQGTGADLTAATVAATKGTQLNSAADIPDSVTAAQVGKSLNFTVTATKVAGGKDLQGWQQVGVTDYTNTAKNGKTQFGQAVVTLDASKITDGMKISVNGVEKTIRLKGTAASGEIDLTSINATTATAGNKAAIAQAIANAFAQASTGGVEVGVDGNNNLIISEKINPDRTSAATTEVQKKMETAEGFKSLLSFQTPGDPVEAVDGTVTLNINTGKVYDGTTLTITDASGNEQKFALTNDKTKTGTTSDGATYVYMGSNTAQALKTALGTGVNATVGSDGKTLSIKYTVPSTVTSASQVQAKAELTGKKGLRLQIGDTAESFNQLNVQIKDCHTDALGIADISIADQESAAKAVDAIKEAINYVSDVRGTLGATRNRLDHTINNLSVMTENIQDAESTIRDTDVAEEMMAYTKNNILIQSAQAMLAQANQVPQGVLQLLQ